SPAALAAADPGRSQCLRLRTGPGPAAGSGARLLARLSGSRGPGLALGPPDGGHGRGTAGSQGTREQRPPDPGGLRLSRSAAGDGSRYLPAVKPVAPAVA